MKLDSDFSQNYENKQQHEMRTVYFGHEVFILSTIACYLNRNSVIDDNIKPTMDKNTGFHVIPFLIISNQTFPKKDMDFSWYL